MKKLLILLSNNNFTIVTGVTFPPFAVVDLSYNNISTIGTDMHSNWGSLSSLFMQGNPSICNVQYNRLPLIFSANDTGGSSNPSTQVFCECASNYVGTDVCIPEAEAYLTLPVLLSGYSDAYVGSSSVGYTMINGSVAFGQIYQKK